MCQITRDNSRCGYCDWCACYVVHRKSRTPSNFHIRRPLHKKPFTQKTLKAEPLYTRGDSNHSCNTRNILHHTSLQYNQMQVHQKTFTPKSSYAKLLLQKNVYTRDLLHQKTFNVRDIWHQIFFTPPDSTPEPSCAKITLRQKTYIRPKTFTKRTRCARSIRQRQFEPKTFDAKKTFKPKASDTKKSFTADNFYTNQLYAETCLLQKKPLHQRVFHQTPFSPEASYTRSLFAPEAV